MRRVLVAGSSVGVFASLLLPAAARAEPVACPAGHHIGVVGGGIYGEIETEQAGPALAVEYGRRVNFGCRRWTPDGAHGWTLTPTARYALAFGDEITQVGTVDVGVGIDLLWFDLSVHGGAALTSDGFAGVAGLRFGTLRSLVVLRADRHFAAERSALLVTGGVDLLVALGVFEHSGGDDAADQTDARPGRGRRSVEERIGPRRDR